MKCDKKNLLKEMMGIKNDILRDQKRVREKRVQLKEEMQKWGQKKDAKKNRS